MENKVDRSPSTQTEVLQPFTKYSGTPFCLKEKQITFLGTRSKAFSRSVNKYKKQILIFGLRGSPSPFKICTNKLSIQFQLFWDTLLSQRKTNNFPWHQIKSLFQVNKYKKQILIFGLRGSPFPFKICTNKLSIRFLRIIMSNITSSIKTIKSSVPG